MKMLWSWTQVFLLIQMWNIPTAEAENDCTVTLPTPVDLNETAQPGLVLLNFSVGMSEGWSFNVSSPSDVLNSYFRLQQNQSVLQLILNKTFDLEEVFDIIKEVVKVIEFRFKCITPTNVEVDYDSYVVVLPVNEFAPQFHSFPPSGFNVSEATVLGVTFIQLAKYVIDRDVIRNRPSFEFNLLPHEDETVDGSGLLRFSDIGTVMGSLALNKPLDFEAMPPDKAFYLTRVSVGDRQGLTSTSTLRINVLDADDQPPEFWYPSCAKPCFTDYRAAIREDSQGVIDYLEPAPIAARDLDTLDSPISYNLKQGDPDDFHKYISIDSSTGAVSVIAKINDTSIAAFFIIVEAVEKTPLQHSEQTLLWLSVRGRNLTDPTLPPLVVLHEAGSEFRVAVIVLGVLLGLVLLGLVLCVLCACSKRARTSVPVLGRAIGKLSLQGEPSREARISSSGNNNGNSPRKTSDDGQVDFVNFRMIHSRPASEASTLRPYRGSQEDQVAEGSQIHNSQEGHLAGASEIDYSQEMAQEDDAVSGRVSTVSESVHFADNVDLIEQGVYDGDRDRERGGVSNPACDYDEQLDGVEEIYAP